MKKLAIVWKNNDNGNRNLRFDLTKNVYSFWDLNTKLGKTPRVLKRQLKFCEKQFEIAMNEAMDDYSNININSRDPENTLFLTECLSDVLKKVVDIKSIIEDIEEALEDLEENNRDR